MTDSVLARVAQGDPRAVRECIDQFGSLIWAIARRLTRTHADPAAVKAALADATVAGAGFELTGMFPVIVENGTVKVELS